MSEDVSDGSISFSQSEIIGLILQVATAITFTNSAIVALIHENNDAAVEHLSTSGANMDQLLKTLRLKLRPAGQPT